MAPSFWEGFGDSRELSREELVLFEHATNDSPIWGMMTERQQDYMVEEYTDPDIIEEKFGHLVDIVADGGIGGILPSTVVDCTGDVPVVIRKGLGPWEEIPQD